MSRMPAVLSLTWRTYSLTEVRLSIRSSIMLTTATLAPPCSGPHRALTPAATAENRLPPLLPTMRTVEVLQFCS